MLPPIGICKHGIQTPFGIKISDDAEPTPVCWACVYERLMESVPLLAKKHGADFTIVGRVTSWMALNTRIAVYFSGSWTYDFFIQYIGEMNQCDRFIYVFRDAIREQYKFDVLDLSIDDPMQLDKVFVRAAEFLKGVMKEAAEKEEDKDNAEGKPSDDVPEGPVSDANGDTAAD